MNIFADGSVSLVTITQIVTSICFKLTPLDNGNILLKVCTFDRADIK
jgi:hypothetical protein